MEQEEYQDITGVNKPKRDERGRLLPGSTANPFGRPKGSISITAEIKKKLAEVPEGERKSYLDLIILKILKKAIIEENENMLKTIWSYMDGTPKQTFGLDPDDLITEVEVKIKSADEIISQRGRTSDQGLSKEPDGVSLEEEQDNS